VRAHVGEEGLQFGEDDEVLAVRVVEHLLVNPAVVDERGGVLNRSSLSFKVEISVRGWKFETVG